MYDLPTSRISCLAPVIHYLLPSNLKLHADFEWPPCCHFTFCKKNYVKKIFTFFNMLPHAIARHNTIVSPISEGCTAVMVVLLTEEN